MFWLLILGVAAWWFGWFDWITGENWFGSLMLLIGVVAFSVGTAVIFQWLLGKPNDSDI
jgi:hypothetical protein